MTCSVCNLARAVMWTHTQRVGRRTVTWVICNGCELSEIRA